METIASRLGSVSVCACVIALCGASLEAAEPAPGLEGRRGAGRHDAHGSRPDGGLRVPDVCPRRAWRTRSPPRRSRWPTRGTTRSCSSPATSSTSADAFTNRVTERVKAKYGLPRENIVLFASHTHAGPAPVEPTDRAEPDAGPRRASRTTSPTHKSWRTRSSP